MNEEMKKALEEMLATFKSGLKEGITKEEMTASLATVKGEIEAKFENLVSADALKTEFENFSRKITADLEKTANKTAQKESVGIAKAIVDMFEENGLKSLADLTKVKGQEIELKADNPLIAANMTGDYARTKPISDLRFPNERTNAFIGRGITTGTLETGKNMLMWTVGTFTDHVAYIGELEDATTTVDGSKIIAADKTRELSGIVARAIISGRSFEDLPQLAQRVENKLMGRMGLWLDQKVWDGEGNDATKKYEMYGVKLQNTPFDNTVVPKVFKPNVADLADACKLQAKLMYAPVNTVWMSASLSFKLQRTKDTSGNYIINKLVDGTLMMAGLTVIETELFGGDTEQMLVGDIKVIQYWIKRNLTAEFERIAKSDSWNLYVYARQQVLVEDEDIKALIYVDNVATALQAIDTDEA